MKVILYYMLEMATLEELEEMTILFWENRYWNPMVVMAIAG